MREIGVWLNTDVGSRRDEIHEICRAEGVDICAWWVGVLNVTMFEEVKNEFMGSTIPCRVVWIGEDEIRPCRAGEGIEIHGTEMREMDLVRDMLERSLRGEVFVGCPFRYRVVFIREDGGKDYCIRRLIGKSQAKEKPSPYPCENEGCVFYEGCRAGGCEIARWQEGTCSLEEQWKEKVREYISRREGTNQPNKLSGGLEITLRHIPTSEKGGMPWKKFAAMTQCSLM